MTRFLYERLEAPLNLARFGEPLLPSAGSTWPVFESHSETPPVTWVKTHRPDWLLNLSESLHLEFHDESRMQSLIRDYREAFAAAPEITPIDFIQRAKRGENVTQVRVTHAFFDHLARAVLYLRGSASSSFGPRNVRKENSVLSRAPICLAAIARATTIANMSSSASFFLAPSLDNGSINQSDEATALEWLLRRERIYKYLQLQILDSAFGKYSDSFALIGGTKFTVSARGPLAALHDSMRDVDLYVVCSENLIGGVLRSSFADRVRAVTALPTTKPLGALYDGQVDVFAKEVADYAQEIQRNRPLVILSQCGPMNAVIAAQLLESSMSHVALVDIGRALEILVGDHKTSAGIYTRSTGHVGKFTYLLPVSPEKWRASRERIQA